MIFNKNPKMWITICYVIIINKSHKTLSFTNLLIVPSTNMKEKSMFVQLIISESLIVNMTQQREMRFIEKTAEVARSLPIYQ